MNIRIYMFIKLAYHAVTGLHISWVCVCDVGLIHFAQNLQCEPAQFIASFPTNDPGTSTISEAFFTKLPMVTLRATLGVNEAVIQASWHKWPLWHRQTPRWIWHAWPIAECLLLPHTIALTQVATLLMASEKLFPMTRAKQILSAVICQQKLATFDK